MDDNEPITPDALNYDRYATFILDREFIMTQGKILLKGMPYLYSEGSRSVAVRLLKVWKEPEIEGEFIYLSLQELQTDRTFTVSWNLDYEGDYFLWSLADYETLAQLPK